MSNDVVAGAKLPVFWGDPELQGLHIGLFIALAALLVFWVVLNRSTTGYEVRAVGLNPEAARYSGISVSQNYVRVMAVCGLFAGLAGAARRARLAVPPRHQRHPDLAGRVPRYRRRAAGRNTALARPRRAALRRAAQRHLAAQPRPVDLRPVLASNLTLIIQGLIVLVVSADVLVLGLLRRGRGFIGAAPADPVPRPRRGGRSDGAPPPEPGPWRARRSRRSEPGRGARLAWGASRWACSRRSSPCRRRSAHPRAVAGARRHRRRRGRVRGARGREAAGLARSSPASRRASARSPPRSRARRTSTTCSSGRR